MNTTSNTKLQVANAPGRVILTVDGKPAARVESYRIRQMGSWVSGWKVYMEATAAKPLDYRTKAEAVAAAKTALGF